MRLLSIVPIARGIRKETLTYFSTKDIEAGALVTVPLRKKEISGIVLESIDAMQNKSVIKDMDFSVRKIIDFNNEVSIPNYIMRSGAKIAELSATSIGSVIASIIPKICLENPKLFFSNKAKSVLEEVPSRKQFEVLALQDGDEYRMDTYRGLVRESFAKKKSIVFICPTNQKALEIKEMLEKGIQEYTVILENTTSKKTLDNFYKKIKTETHSLLIIGSFYTLSLLPSNIGTIVIEEESSIYYKNRRRPFLDIRTTIEQIAKSLDVRLILGDKLLSIQTLAKVREGFFVEYGRIDKRNQYKIQTLVIDTKPKEGEKKKFEILSTELKEMILYSIKNNKKMLIYATRRGVASQTVCNDCGTTVVCNVCESPFVLHTVKDKRFYICHHCGHKKEATENCLTCDSWNLVPLGIGIEKIEDEVNKLSKKEILRIDSDICKTPKEIKERIKKFYNEENILITTDLGLQYIKSQSIDYVAIPSIDSMLSFPDFRTTEHVMHTILDLKLKATECILVQARDTKHKIIEQALAGDLESFMNEEIKARKQFGYEPYKTIIKISIEDKKERVRIIAQDVVSKLRDYNPTLFQAMFKSKRGNSILNLIIKLDKKNWPNETLLQTLLSFPPNIKIDTTPTSLL